MPKSAANLSLDRIQRAAERVGRQAGCRLIVLFGSAARAEPRAPEDLDVGVLGGAGARGGEALDTVELTNRFIRELGVQHVDVVDLGRADPLILMFVARDGVPLYEAAPGQFACFASLAARRYADTKKFRDTERREIRDFLARERPTP